MLFPHVNWTRPKYSEYPRIWHYFEVEKNSGDIERYRIQDLPKSRTEDALAFMVNHLCKEEPLSQAYEIYNDNAAMKILKCCWRIIIKQKAVLVCFKEGSDEIVGINMNFVVCKYDVWNDKFDIIDQNLFSMIDISRLLWFRFKYQLETLETSLKLHDMSDVVRSISKDLNEFKHYGVDKYLTAVGLSVAQQHRGRGIGVQLLKTREAFCNEFGIKLTLNIFSSNFSNACADKAGFKLEKIRRYDDIRNEYPHLPHVNSDVLTFKFMEFARSYQGRTGSPKAHRALWSKGAKIWLEAVSFGRMLKQKASF